MATKTPEERFLRMVSVNAESGCWTWVGSVRPNGYAQFNAGGNRIVKAHRWAYEHWRGEIPTGRDLDHQCHNRDKTCAGGWACIHRRCVNPWHLEPATRSENLRAGRRPSNKQARLTHCKRGHAFAGRNLVVRPNGHRVCRTCAVMRTNKWRNARKVTR